MFGGEAEGPFSCKTSAESNYADLLSKNSHQKMQNATALVA